VKQSKGNSNSSWKPLKRQPTPEKWLLLEVMLDVWSFTDSAGRFYRCEIDSAGNERWAVKVIRAEREWISPTLGAESHLDLGDDVLGLA
jgi:hypothetical protein